MAEFVANHTKNTFDCRNDVAEEMQTLVKVDTYVWNATIKISSGLDETIKEREKTKSSWLNTNPNWMKPWYAI